MVPSAGGRLNAHRIGIGMPYSIQIVAAEHGSTNMKSFNSLRHSLQAQRGKTPEYFHTSLGPNMLDNE